MSERPQPPLRKCASCLYNLTGVTSPTCPECGYTPTSELILVGRRAAFLELTAVRQWSPFFWVLLPIVVASLLTGEHLVGSIFGAVAVASLAWGEISGRMFIKQTPQTQRRVVRRAWRLGLLWLHLPFMLVAYELGAAHLAASCGLMDPRFFGKHAFIAGFAGTIVAWPIWRRSMERLLRIAGADEDVRAASRYTDAGIWAIGPAALNLALPAVVLALVWLVDVLGLSWWD